MRNYSFIPAVILISAIGCSPAPHTDTNQSDRAEDDTTHNEVIGNASVSDTQGTTIGSAILKRSSDGLFLALDLQNVPAGSHALHLHEQGSCDGPDFKSAGGHLNPYGKSHGKLSSNAKHLGDLPNLDVASNGTARTIVEIEAASDDVLSFIFDEDGTAVMLHADADDYQSDPAGAAGPRIACGVIERAS
jgi:superoxide dismutase, Cu-Zn family